MRRLALSTISFLLGLGIAEVLGEDALIILIVILFLALWPK